jgi:hypothetical protein
LEREGGWNYRLLMKRRKSWLAWYPIAKRTEAFCLATKIFCDMDVGLHETPAWDYGRADQASVATERLLKVKYLVRMYNDSSGLCAEDVKYIYHVFIYLGLK